MGKPGGFQEHERQDPGYRPRDERVGDFKGVELRLSEEELRQQAARCMDCGTPFCHGCGCPLSNCVPEINDLAYRGRWREALDILLATNRFPEFTARVCPALCEGSCVLGIDRQPVAIRQIELAVIETAFEKGLLRPEPPERRRDERVAVIGSGPAGLAAADALNRSGFRVTVYDHARKPGGILRYGIPDFKLEKWIIDRRVRLMEDEGVAFELGVDVGIDLSYRYLASRYAAVCLAAGAREPRDLKVPGRELTGIHFAMEYLIQQNRRNAGEPIDGTEIRADGRSVVIIGGGDTGSDCLGTALRQNAKHVLQIEILPRPPEERAPGTPWPAWPYQLRESSSHLEGGERRWSVLTREFAGEGGAVRRLRAIGVEWELDHGRPMRMREMPGTEFEVDADLVLIAMGFTGPRRGPMIADLDLALDPRGNVKRDADNMTSVPGVFVTGDMAQGASLVVRAIADGTRAAGGIARYLDRPH